MLTNLNFLKVGQQWPPPGEEIRLSKYEKNRLIFEGRHEEVYKESFKRISRVIGNFEQIVNSIEQKIFTLPEETIIYPGHGKSTTVGWEKTHNRFL